MEPDELRMTTDVAIVVWRSQIKPSGSVHHRVRSRRSSVTVHEV